MKMNSDGCCSFASVYISSQSSSVTSENKENTDSPSDAKYCGRTKRNAMVPIIAKTSGKVVQEITTNHESANMTIEWIQITKKRRIRVLLMAGTERNNAVTKICNFFSNRMALSAFMARKARTARNTRSRRKIRGLNLEALCRIYWIQSVKLDTTTIRSKRG